MTAVNYPKKDNYTEIVAVAVGPIFLVFAFLYACLNGSPGAFMGSLAAVSAVVFLVSLGNTSITTAQVLYQYNDSDSNSSSVNVSENATSPANLGLPYLSTSFAGSVACYLAITILLALWGYYWNLPSKVRRVNRRVQQERILLHNDGEDEDTASTSSAAANTGSTVFAGYARKVAVCVIVVAFMGWGIMVGGHHQRISRISEEGAYINNIFYFDFGQWGSIVLTPFLLLFALIHAGASGRVSSVMGVVVAILNGFVLTSLGYYLIHDVGEWLKNECKDGKDCNFSVPKSAAALSEIVGGFLFVFFWACLMGVWPFFTNHANVKSMRTTTSDQMVVPTGYSNSQERSIRKDDDDDVEALRV